MEARMSLRTLTSHLLGKYGIQPSRKLDQYYMINDEALERIIKALHLSKEETLLEVGAGLGVITKIMAPMVKETIAIEKDRRMFPILLKEMPESVKVVQGDAMKIPLPDADKFFSDIPYSVSLPLTLRLLRTRFSLGAIVCQREFAEKLMARPGSAQYSRVSVIAQYYADIEPIVTIYRGDFMPEPPVTSVALLFERKRDKNRDFERFVTEAFRHRRKKMKGVGKRPEELPVEEFVSVFEAIE